ncbi:hypothetical protein N5923_04035 [Erwiniaceae bacterium BAC15a-03b]|uniref:Uncharacterized protein n=1 Tax=Winslowiella arboricola TaxID=2978220 RepID=A0A9J6PRI5_9GAMM|nr:hypothetical protein [Winslowiella arboricola]MCU5771821.1 hypothetical protein [Winslowiella arboricola]MCU5776671.1 hypothetical protein [Winslowiella arboricola]
MVNPFCKVDELGFPHFTAVDYIRFRFFPDNQRFLTGNNYLWAYKAGFLVYNRDRIMRYAREYNIPVLLLAGVAVAEAGGKPDRMKGYGILQIRQLIDLIKRNNSLSNRTSIGALAIQLRAAAETMGIDAAKLTHTQQFQLSACLLNNDFNIKVVAKHLHDLILHDYPDADTAKLTDEQIIVAGSRYNRGIQRTKSDFIDSIYAPVGSPLREYSEYGRRIVEKRETIENIMRLAQ